MNAIRSEGIILRRTNYGEADRILQLLTPDYGKLSVMARGVRKEKSRLAGGIELFAISDVVVQQGKGELGILTGARLRTFFSHILDNYDKMQFGYEVLKRVGAAVETVPEPEWYDLAKESLQSLDQPTIPLSLVELYFWLHYVGLLGHALNLAADTQGEKLLANENYSYDVGDMGLRKNPQGNLTAEHIKLLRLASVKPPNVLAQISGLEMVLHDCLWIARQHAQH